MGKLVQVTPLGRLWSYNNAAFYVLGRILEVLHGRPFEDVLQEALLTPLGIDGTCFFAHDLIHRNFAAGHAEFEGRTVIARPWAMPRCGNPIGGLIASADHLMRYAQFQLEGAAVLSDAMRLAAFEPAGPSSDTPAIGLGWWLDDTTGERVVSHSGGANGQPCFFAMIPSRRFALAVLTNGSNGRITARRLLKWAMRTYFGLASPEPQAQGTFDADSWLGTYEARLERRVLRREGERLVLDLTDEEWLDARRYESAPHFARSGGPADWSGHNAYPARQARGAGRKLLARYPWGDPLDAHRPPGRTTQVNPGHASAPPTASPASHRNRSGSKSPLLLRGAQHRRIEVHLCRSWEKRILAHGGELNHTGQ
ncbi:serine hydrolase domain-containing protein [Mesorhizobium sp. M1329]|uniref:serine hydrolase domain-containing protein n=1 Tax=Mesorhizobium sp. M1329 TaxID=2957083 RepID=UPI00333CF586